MFVENLSTQREKATFFIRRHDPLKVIKGLQFSSHLRSPKLFSEAVNDALNYEADVSDDDDAPRHDSSRDPARNTLERSRARLDSVAMLLERRYFEVWREQDSLLGISLYSDSSPVINWERITRHGDGPPF